MPSRLEMIGYHNPELAIKYSCMIEDFPELKPFIYVAPIKLHAEECDVNTIFETILYYVANTGVNVKYANSQYDIIKTYIRSNSWDTIVYYISWLFHNYNIQPKKRQIYIDIITFMQNNGYNKDNITVEFAIYMKDHIKGLGDGYLGYIKNKYTNNQDCIQYTDMYFKKGFKKVYGTDNLSVIKNKCNEINNRGYGKFFSALLFNIAHYVNC